MNLALTSKRSFQFVQGHGLLRNNYYQRFFTSTNPISRWIRNPTVSRWSIIGAAAITFYGVSSCIVDLTTYFINLRHKDVGKIGFYLGFFTGVSLSGLIAFTIRSKFLHPETVCRSALVLIKNNSEVKKFLGSNISPGLSRFYQTTNSNFGGNSILSSFFSHSSMEMMFSVKANNIEAFASVCAEAKRGKVNIKFLAVDILNDPTERVMIIGENDRPVLGEELNQLLLLHGKSEKNDKLKYKFK